VAVVWNDSFAIGMTQIDNQHKELFDRINKLLAAMARGAGGAEVESTVGFLEQYVNTHFGDEEALLRSWRYPAYNAHKALHDRFVRDLLQIKQGIAEGRSLTLLTIEVQRKVSDWLVQHIMKVDMEYATYMRKAA
jgi:hemerythrin